MKKFAFSALILLSGYQVSFAEIEPFECMDEVAFAAFYAAGGAQGLPAFSEPEIGGTRVQKQHPQTYLFGQAKYISGEQGNFAICQYSNHVGLVAQYGQLVKERRDMNSLECSSADCGDPSWREEWLESDPRDQAVISVCVERRNDVDYPSTLCKFDK